MSDSQIPCIVCQEKNTVKIYTLVNPIYRDRNYFIYRCSSCRMTFLYPIPLEEDITLLFQNLYRQENPFLPELAFYFSENKSPEHIARIKKDFDDYLDFLEQAQKQGRLLDLGCGEGFFLSVAQQRGWIPDGVDSSEDAIKRAKEKFNLNVTLGTVESVDFQENQFDAVTLLDFAEHLSEPTQTYEKIHHWLKPGGVMLIATPNQASILAWAAHLVYLISFGTVKGPLYRIYMLPHFLYYTPRTLTELLNKMGFEIIAVKKSNTDLGRLHLNFFMRITLQILFGISNLLGLQKQDYVDCPQNIIIMILSKIIKNDIMTYANGIDSWKI